MISKETHEVSIPNLDTMEVEELEEFRLVLSLLQQYVWFKTHAIEERLGGKINLALEHEFDCDRVYKQLPEWARW